MKRIPANIEVETDDGGNPLTVRVKMEKSRIKGVEGHEIAEFEERITDYLRQGSNPEIVWKFTD